MLCHLKNDHSVLIQQMKDITCDEISYILNTHYNHNEFNIHLKSMFNIKEVEDDENSVIIK